MNAELASELWNYIQQAGDRLQGQLPPHPRHPQGRNPYAHVAICIKSHFGDSYKNLPDESYDSIIEFIEYLVDNPR